MITIDDCKKLEIRIGTVVSAHKVENIDKLIKFIFDIGNREKKQIMTDIAEFFPNLNILIGKQLPLLLNIEPKEPEFKQ